MTNLYTTGYEGENIYTFLQKMLRGNIDAIIDIRENPFSRKPGFSQKALVKELKSVGIGYYHYQELGTPKPLREFLTEEKDYDSFFDEYRMFLHEFRESLDDLIEIGSQKNICLMCFEKDPHLCHRKIVAELIEEYAGKKINVIHL